MFKATFLFNFKLAFTFPIDLQDWFGLFVTCYSVLGDFILSLFQILFPLKLLIFYRCFYDALIPKDRYAQIRFGNA